MPKRAKKSRSVRPEIRHQETLAQVETKSYECVRMSRVEYWKNRHPMIDVRAFQRGDDEDLQEKYHPTKRGIQLREDLFQKLIAESPALPKYLMNPRLPQSVYDAYSCGNYATAIFEAFRSVEILVRTRAGLAQEDVGVALVRKAFDPQNGPLADISAPLAEREATAHLFAGAIGSCKSPHSHRDIEYAPDVAVRRIVLASELISIIEEA